jgi:hypothetical protein
VRRFPISVLASVGVLIASAIGDIGPRAAAAYQPVAGGSAVRVELDAVVDAGGAADAERTAKPQLAPDTVRHQPSGSTTTSPTTGHGGDGPPAGLPQPADRPSPGLVVYFREQSGSLDPTHFIASILDPPRTV